MSDHIPDPTYFQIKDKTCCVDSCDGDLSQLCWQLRGGRDHLPYVYRGTERNHVKAIHYLHRIIMERVIGRPLLRSERIDHIDRNPLNNRRSNLRIANASQNAANAPKHRDGNNLYRGVYRRNNGRFSTKICVNRRVIQLGTYDTPEEARDVYQKAAELYHGEFANSGE